VSDSVPKRDLADQDPEGNDVGPNGRPCSWPERDNTDNAGDKGLTLFQRVWARFLNRFLLIFIVSTLITGGAQELLLGGVQLATVLNVVTCALFGARAGGRQFHPLHWVLLAYSVVVLFPMSVIFNTPPMWVTFAFTALATTAWWSLCLSRRRADRRPLRVYVSLPFGQDVLLDTRPFLCGRCRRTCFDVHHVAFAPSAPIHLPSGWQTPVVVEHHKRAGGIVLLAVEVGDDGGLRLVAPPGDFAERQWTGAYGHGWTDEQTAARR
jgi:hypothetical protein